MGAGTLAMIGGTVVIVGFLTLAAGGTLAVQGYSSLGNIGIEALTALLAAFINVRIAAPVVAGIGLAATFGAGVTAQLGAMRINEEIDADFQNTAKWRRMSILNTARSHKFSSDRTIKEYSEEIWNLRSFPVPQTKASAAPEAGSAAASVPRAPK